MSPLQATRQVINKADAVKDGAVVGVSDLKGEGNRFHIHIDRRVAEVLLDQWRRDDCEADHAERDAGIGRRTAVLDKVSEARRAKEVVVRCKEHAAVRRVVCDGAAHRIAHRADNQCLTRLVCWSR